LPFQPYFEGYPVKAPASSVALPFGMEDALIGRFLRSLEFAGEATTSNVVGPAPFLSIITRTQGLRPDTLRDVFLCLSGQSCIDFEHLVVGHRLSAETEEVVQSLIAENPDWLRQRTRFLKIDFGTRTAPLNFAFEMAAGQYVAVLDDDDLVLGHWVETFKTMAARHRGSILRSVAVYQKFDEVETEFGEPSSRAAGEILRLYPQDFDFFSHLQENRTPLIALAFPRAAFSDFGIRFDETLTTSEDWDYLMRAAAICGVESAPEITAIYRHWDKRSSSRTDHSSNEWLENQQYVREKHNQLHMLLAAGSAERLKQILDERDTLARAVRLLGRNTRNTRSNRELQAAVDIAQRVIDNNGSERLNELRVELVKLYASTWWKLSAPVRWFSALTGRRRFRQPEPYDLTEAHLRMAIHGVTNSTSWKITRPLRSLYFYLQRR
jgi:hypothetical protein